MSKPFSSSWHLSTTLQVSSPDLRTLQVIRFIWMGTNRLFRHFDVSKFCRRILWSIRHSLSFNLASPGGPLSSYIAWKLYRAFSPCAVLSCWIWSTRECEHECLGKDWRIIHKRQGKVLEWMCTTVSRKTSENKTDDASLFSCNWTRVWKSLREKHLRFS